MILEKMERKIIEKGIFGNSQMNYLTKFDLYVDIVLIVFVLCKVF